MSELGLKCTLSSIMANKFWSCWWVGLPLLVLLRSFFTGDAQLNCNNRPPPCLNGATCINVEGVTGIQCLCPPDFTGAVCRDRVSNSSATPAATPSPPVLTPTDSETCATSAAANIIWDTTPVGRTIGKLCRQADPQLLDFRSMVRRTCNTGGVWGDPDFSECTLSRRTNAFLLVWFVVQSDSVVTVNSRRQQLEEELSPALSELGAGTGLLPTQAVTNDTVSLTFRISFGVTYLTPSRRDEIGELLLAWLDDRSTLGNFSLVTNETGYQGFLSSDSCPCSATGDLFAEMCETRTPSGPCVCRGSTDCMCAQFYVGDGQRCTLDQDGDGYPDVALDTCNSSIVEERYCINDTCSGVYNPLQNSLSCQNDEGFNGCRSEMGRFGIMWASTEFGETDTQLCPNGENFATRECGPRGWLRAAIQDCASFDFVNAREEALSALNRTGRNFRTRLQDSQAVTSNFRGITGPRRGLSLLPSDLNSTNLLLSGVVDLLDESLSTGESDTSDQTFQDLFSDCADIFSNVLDGNNLNGWLELQEIDAGSQRLLDNAERYGLYLSNAMNDTVGRWVWGRDNVVFGSSRNNPEESTTFPESLDDLVNTSFSMIPAQITIPAQFLMERRGANARTVPVTTILFQNMEEALPSNANGSRVASMVLSTQVRMRRVQSDALVQEPVTLSFTFEADENVSEYRCAYWEFSDPVGNGSWAFDGIEMVSTTTEDGMTTVNCTSTHLTSFAVLVDVSGILSSDDNDTISAGELVALQIVSYIGCAISIICLIATIIFFLAMGKELFTSVHYFIHLNLAISLCLGYLVFVTSVQLARANQGACIFIAALLHYLFLAVFCWMLCEGIMLYLMLVVVFSTLIRKWWLFLLLGYGLPVIPVAVSVGVRTSDYGVRDTDGNLTFCWLSTANGVIWAFVAPMLAIITVNVFFLCLALATVYRSIHAKVKRRNHDSKFNESYEIFKPLFKATIVLLPILGLTWVFGLFAVNENTTVFAWLFTICNSLQGVFIFMFHVLRSEKVWQSSHAKFLRGKASSTFRSTMRTSTTGTMTKKPPTSYALSASMSTDDTKMIATSTAKDIELGAAGTWNSTVDKQELDIEDGVTGIDAKESQAITECRNNTSDTHLDTDSGST